MRNEFDLKLERLSNDLIRMGGLIEEAIANSITALRDGDKELARRVVKNDNMVDDMEKTIESLSLSIILREQPVARDLRKVSAALKMVTDLERIGDNAADIAEISLSADVKSVMHIIKDIQIMTEKVVVMVSKSVDSYVKADLELAHNVIDSDDEVDDLFNSIKEKIVYMLKNDECGSDVAVDTMMVVKYLERIADHAVNICEWVEFFVTGEYKNTQII